MSILKTDGFYPVARDGDAWLLLPEGEQPDKESEDQLYHQWYDGRMYDPLPLQVWCKHRDFHWLRPEDKKEWSSKEVIA